MNGPHDHEASMQLLVSAHVCGLLNKIWGSVTRLGRFSMTRGPLSQYATVPVLGPFEDGCTFQTGYLETRRISVNHPFWLTVPGIEPRTHCGFGLIFSPENLILTREPNP
jgi:hypothetical protein